MKMKFFIDLPFHHLEYSRIAQFILDVGHEVIDEPFESSYVVRLLGRPVNVYRDVEQIIIIGDFSRPQTVPAKATCIDILTGMVQMPAGKNVQWRHYVSEHLLDPLDTM